ncbi:hypothetical protein SFRURICE_003996 [Spodoptera frugiperda]|uniref:SFRICE_019822 n=1 Tax=Spodoptera frugiperda TaxID=7108 RepID=A0A2H1VWX7_SPOFR|nr:hypothetical protein SFRURICE_003996 [Spodoptera frugiperda]
MIEAHIHEQYSATHDTVIVVLLLSSLAMNISLQNYLKLVESYVRIELNYYMHINEENGPVSKICHPILVKHA